MNKRQQEEKRLRQIAKATKTSKMKRGDSLRQNVEVVENKKPISNAREQRNRLEKLTEEVLEDLVKDKCLYSNIYYKEDIKATQENFKYGGFQSENGVKLEFPKINSGREHYFGFETVNHHERGDLVRIHYAAVKAESGMNCRNEQVDLNPKKLSARKLLTIIGEFK